MTPAQLLSDQTLPFNDFPTETFVFDARVVTALVISDQKGESWQEGGLLDDPVIKLAVEKSQFVGFDPPREGHVGIAFRSKSWRVLAVDTTDDAGSVQITLASEAT